ncbi:hypothetical protein A2U01_0015496 [Trifolium medium]|uniref:Uncharacterized protein n=1 Tax=Trifolium medium TaxID=97028 RepID=A0A392N7R1_9FABA|nr:hypothetical protein [Trifolium medium]
MFNRAIKESDETYLKGTTSGLPMRVILVAKQESSNIEEENNVSTDQDWGRLSRGVWTNCSIQ